MHIVECILLMHIVTYMHLVNAYDMQILISIRESSRRHYKAYIDIIHPI